MSSTYLQVSSATVPSTTLRKIKTEPQSALRASSYPDIKIKIEGPSTPVPTIKVETPQTPTPHINIEPQSTPRLSSYPDHQMALSSTNLWIEAPETPTPKIKSEPQSTPRLSSIPHGLPHLSPQCTLKTSSTPHTRTHLAPKPTLELFSSPLSPYPSSLSSPSKSPLKRVHNKRVFKNTRPYRQTRGGLKTPTVPRAEPLPSDNWVRIDKWRAEAKLGVTPCPGEVGAPSGARVKGYRVREKKLERYMDYGWWEKKYGVVIEDREEGEEGDKVVEENEEEEFDEMDVANDGIGEMVDLLVDEQRKKNWGLMSVAQQALDVLNPRKDSVMG
jgi:hypothetical protein